MKRNKTFSGGSTGTVVTIRRTNSTELYIANVGDSTSIASLSGKLLILSKDHKPEDREEKKRIINAGGVLRRGYACKKGAMCLAVSRAFGDFSLKDNPSLPREKQIIIVDPFVANYTVSTEWDFVLLASDGVWNGFGGNVVSSYEKVKNFVLERKQKGVKIETICKDLAQASLNSRDNIAILLIYISNEQKRSILRLRNPPARLNGGTPKQSTLSRSKEVVLIMFIVLFAPHHCFFYQVQDPVQN